MLPGPCCVRFHRAKLQPKLPALEQTIVFGECFLDPVAYGFTAPNFNPNFRDARRPCETAVESRQDHEEMTHGETFFAKLDCELEDCFVEWRIESECGQFLVARVAREAPQLAAQFVRQSRGCALQADVLLNRLWEEQRTQAHRPHVLKLRSLRLLLLNINWNPDVHSSVALLCNLKKNKSGRGARPRCRKRGQATLPDLFYSCRFI